MSLSKNETCEICGKGGAFYYSPQFSVIRTCIFHHQYHEVMFPQIIQKQLGLKVINENQLHYCQICDSKLNNDEVSQITIEDRLICCTAHQSARFCWQPELEKEWFIFKHYNNPVHRDNTEHIKKFMQWRKVRRLKLNYEPKIINHIHYD